MTFQLALPNLTGVWLKSGGGQKGRSGAQRAFPMYTAEGSTAPGGRLPFSLDSDAYNSFYFLIYYSSTFQS